jgi:hypothetical protein
MAKTYYLITSNSNGSLSYMAKGTYRAMRKLCREGYHHVTSIDDCNYAKAMRKYSVHR